MCKYNHTVCIFDGIREMLDILSHSGYELGIVTSKTREELVHDFSVFDIDFYFKTSVCADDTAEHKPNPEPLLKYMELTKCNNQEILYIGDSKYDMECAKKTGINFALAGWGAKKKIDTALWLETPMNVIKKFT